MFKKDVKKMLTSMVLILFLLTAFVSAVFADSSMSHTIQYDMEGRIELRKQSGHEYGTGARMRQEITGEGSMEKESDIFMEEGYIRVDDQQDWVTAEDAMRNLTVTNSTRLFTPPAFVYDGTDARVWWEEVHRAFRPVFFTGDEAPDFSAREEARLWRALTRQIWAVSVEANPGHFGELNAGFEAVYRPGTENMAFFNAEDYFEIEQHAATGDGTLRRFIDISSPVSQAFLHEDMRVDGTASVTEAFSLINTTRLTSRFWHELF